MTGNDALSHLRKRWVVGIVAFSTGVTGSTIAFLFHENQLEPLADVLVGTALSVNQPITTTITSIDVILGLALTYLIYKTYKRQNNILGTHSQILQAAHRPSLRAHDEPEITSEHPINDDLLDEGMDKEYVKVKLENTGNDIAEGLQLHCLISCEGTADEEFEPLGNKLQLVAEDAQLVMGDSSLRPDNTHRTFYTGVSTADHVEGDRKSNSLGTLLESLTCDHEDVGAIRFGFAVTYESALDHDMSGKMTNVDCVYLRPAWELSKETELESPSMVEACREADEYEIEYLRNRAEDPLEHRTIE